MSVFDSYMLLLVALGVLHKKTVASTKDSIPTPWTLLDTCQVGLFCSIKGVRRKCIEYFIFGRSPIGNFHSVRTGPMTLVNGTFSIVICSNPGLLGPGLFGTRYIRHAFLMFLCLVLGDAHLSQLTIVPDLNFNSIFRVVFWLAKCRSSFFVVDVHRHITVQLCYAILPLVVTNHGLSQALSSLPGFEAS